MAIGLKHLFICYSRRDSEDNALRLYDELTAGPPRYEVWIEQRKLRPGVNWALSISDALQNCEALLFLITEDSVSKASNCNSEWQTVLLHHKPVLTLGFTKTAEVPFQLENLQSIDFSDDFDAGIARLRIELRKMASPEGKIDFLERRLPGLLRDAGNAPASERRWKAEAEIEAVQAQINELRHQTPVASPHGAAARRCFVAVPPYFQGRSKEQAFITAFVANAEQVVLNVVGESGVGKSTLVGRVLNSMVASNPSQLDDAIFIDAAKSENVTMVGLLSSLRNFIASSGRRLLGPGTETEDEKDELARYLESLKSLRIVVVVENFELALDPVSLTCRSEMESAISIWLQQRTSNVKLILTTQIDPKNPCFISRTRQARIKLGPLKTLEGVKMLRALDTDGTVGLQTEWEEVLTKACEAVDGLPRALEGLYSCLVTERKFTLSTLIADLGRLPESVVQWIVSKLFNRLDRGTHAVALSLAIFGRSVDHLAVEFLLFPFENGESAVVRLERLVDMRLARSNGNQYYLQRLELEFLLGTLPGDPLSAGVDPPSMSRIYLYRRAADYFQMRKEELRKRALGPGGSAEIYAPLEIDEFRLRYAGEDFGRAARVLLEIERRELMIRGHYQLLAELHTKLIGRLTEPGVEMDNLSGLGTALYRLGRSEEAYAHFKEALAIARARGDGNSEARVTGSLGNIFSEVGQIDEAIVYYTRALSISRDLRNSELEAAYLICIGNRLGELGQVDEAIAKLEQALQIVGPFSSEDEPIALTNLAILNLDKGNYSKAVMLAQKAVAFGEELRSGLVQSHSHWCCALGHLLGERLTSAADEISLAAIHDFPPLNHEVALLMGLIAYRQQRDTKAKEGFQRAIGAASALLKHNAKNYGALDVIGLAECGLALGGDMSAASRSRRRFQAARRICRADGVVKRAMALLRALARNSADQPFMPAIEAAVQGKWSKADTVF